MNQAAIILIALSILFAAGCASQSPQAQSAGSPKSPPSPPSSTAEGSKATSERPGVTTRTGDGSSGTAAEADGSATQGPPTTQRADTSSARAAGSSSSAADDVRDLVEVAMKQGDLAFKEQRYEQAAAEYQLALMDDPKYARAWDALGITYWKMSEQLRKGGEKERAYAVHLQSLACYRKALGYDPNAPLYWLHYAAGLREWTNPQMLREADEAERRGQYLFQQEVLHQGKH